MNTIYYNFELSRNLYDRDVAAGPDYLVPAQFIPPANTSTFRGGGLALANFITNMNAINPGLVATGIFNNVEAFVLNPPQPIPLATILSQKPVDYYNQLTRKTGREKVTFTDITYAVMFTSFAYKPTGDAVAVDCLTQVTILFFYLP